jgi:hypothetical protein
MQKIQTLGEMMAEEDAAALARFEKERPAIDAQAAEQVRHRDLLRATVPVYMAHAGAVVGRFESENAADAYAEARGWNLDDTMVGGSEADLRTRMADIAAEENAEEDESDEDIADVAKQAGP